MIPVSTEAAEEARRQAVRDASFLIVAHGRNGVIGNGSEIPWRHRADMMHFRNATLGCALIVGRTTFDTLPASMPGRDVVVVTSRPISADAVAVALPSFEEAVRIAVEDLGVHAIAFAGGPRIYEAAMALPWMRRAIITDIGAEPQGTAFMPPLGAEWVEESSSPLASREGEPDALVRTMVRR